MPRGVVFYRTKGSKAKGTHVHFLRPNTNTTYCGRDLRNHYHDYNVRGSTAPICDVCLKSQKQRGNF